MRISIIIPTYMEEATIGRLLQHLEKIKNPKVCEVLVIDAKSTDKTAEFAQNLGATVLLSDQKSRAAQMNLGAQHSQGDLLYFVHADTLPPVTFVQNIEKAIATGHQMGCFRYRFDSPSLMLRLNSFFTRFHFLWCQGGDKTLYLPKKLFFELGGFDPKFLVMEEYNFFKKAQKAGIFIHVMPEYALVSARKYEGRSWLRVQIANFVAFRMFSMGKPSEEIKKTYGRMIDGKGKIKNKLHL